jgi:hypothetical protein
VTNPRATRFPPSRRKEIAKNRKNRSPVSLQNRRKKIPIVTEAIAMAPNSNRFIFPQSASQMIPYKKMSSPIKAGNSRHVKRLISGRSNLSAISNVLLSANAVKHKPPHRRRRYPLL